MTISCTKKVLDKLKAAKQISEEKEGLHLFNWYADLLTFNRKKYCLFVNSVTLFSFFMYVGTKKEVQKIESNFIEKLQEQIVREIGFNEQFISSINSNAESFKFTKTNSRSILGVMNDYKRLIEYYSVDRNDAKNSLLVISNRLNNLPSGMLKYKYPKEVQKDEMEKLLKGG